MVAELHVSFVDRRFFNRDNGRFNLDANRNPDLRSDAVGRSPVNSSSCLVSIIVQYVIQNVVPEGVWPGEVGISHCE